MFTEVALQSKILEVCKRIWGIIRFDWTETFRTGVQIPYSPPKPTEIYITKHFAARYHSRICNKHENLKYRKRHIKEKYGKILQNVPITNKRTPQLIKVKSDKTFVVCRHKGSPHHITLITCYMDDIQDD